jgi:hypothetical protein
MINALFPNQIDFVFAGLLIAVIVGAAIWAANKHKL